MTKLRYYLSLCFFSFALSSAQVGIGTSSPNPSAAMDVNVSSLPANNKKGLLLPQVALTSRTDVVTIANPATGLLVYNTADSNTGTKDVEKDTYYFWNGVEWTNLSTLSEVRRELLPQVFFLAEGNIGTTTPQNVYAGADNVNAAPVQVRFNPSSVVLNTGNNLTLNNNSNFTVNTKCNYEISGFINYNPNVALNTGGVKGHTNVEFAIQKSDNGTNWTTVVKTVGVWSAGTTVNNRSNNIPPVTVALDKGNLIRCTVQKTEGLDHTTSAQMSAPTGLSYAKVLKIQKVD